MISRDNLPPSGGHCYCKLLREWKLLSISSAGHVRSQTSLLSPGRGPTAYRFGSFSWNWWRWSAYLAGTQKPWGKGNSPNKSGAESEDGGISLLSAEGGAVSADALAPRGLVQHLKRDRVDGGEAFKRGQGQALLWRPTYQEHQAVEEQGVEESYGPRHLVGENHAALRGTNRKMRREGLSKRG